MATTHDDSAMNGIHSAVVLPPAPDPVIDSLRGLVDPAIPANDPTTVHLRAGALFSRLKALNRAANHATRAHKQATADSRHDMDQTYLGLQNLLYEKRHLEREIEKCRQFASIYQDIPFHSLDEFKQLAPAEARTEEVLADEHQLMCNRLSFELSERQRLDLRRRELIKEKEDLLKEGKAKQTTLDAVKAHIDVLMKSATEVQKKVGELIQVTERPQSTRPSTPTPGPS